MKTFEQYKAENSFRCFINKNLWERLERHGFDACAKRMLNRKKYGDRIIRDGEYSNNSITALIKSDNPCMIARIGASEMNFLFHYLDVKLDGGNSKDLQKAIDRISLLSGFFPNDIELAPRLADTYLNAIQYMDICGVWNLYMEDYILDHYAPACELVRLQYLEPWNAENCKPWSSALKGKRVLIVHPFAESIKKQYSRHKEIFSNKFEYEDILPDFDLFTIKAVQSLGGENGKYANWFDALDGMLDEINAINYDVAILGCGAYGLPLAAEIKKTGRKAIHLGGATQLMFGIWGNRWEQIPSIKELCNDYWIKPSDSERPKIADKVEGACYW